MDDLIRRSELKQHINSLSSHYLCEWDTLGVLAAVDSIPAVDAVEVVHGTWEPANCFCPICKEDKFKGLDADIWADWMPPYCPNCGARMDGEEAHNAAD